MGSLITHTGTFSIDDRLASQWQYLPVEVPPGTGALRVTLSYPRDAAAVLDLGCLDPAGFRGWSGGARDSFVVAELGATPGYLAGPVTAGLWQVVIGLHLVPASGLPFTVTAEPLSAGSAIPRRAAFFVAGGAGRAAGAFVPACPALAARRGRAYLAGRGPARAHLSLRRGDERGRTRRSRGGARAGLRRRHRPQHGEPSRSPRPRFRQVRRDPAAGAGGDDGARARGGTRGHRVDRLP